MRRLFRDSEGENDRASRNGDVLLAVELVCHRRGLPEAVGLIAPHGLACFGVDGYEGAAVFAEEDDAAGSGERAAP